MLKYLIQKNAGQVPVVHKEEINRKQLSNFFKIIILFLLLLYYIIILSYFRNFTKGTHREQEKHLHITSMGMFQNLACSFQVFINLEIKSLKNLIIVIC